LTFDIEAANMSSPDALEMIERVGKGSFGEVWKARNKNTGAVVAVKLINLEDSEEDIETIQDEIHVLRSIKCDQIIKIFESFTHGHTLWIVMELASGGSIKDVMRPGPIDEQYIAIILKETLYALEYMHNHGKIHRDIKAAVSGNVIVSDVLEYSFITRWKCKIG
jgi:serine/threonine-protein kinase 24/25/MST4